MPRNSLKSIRTKRETGNIILELALALPLFLLFIGGALDLGMLHWSKHILTNAAREGARAAVRAHSDGTGNPEKTRSQVQQVVQDYLDRFHFKDENGAPLVLSHSQFSYNWTGGGGDFLVSLSLDRIPYRMLLLPEARAICFGETKTKKVDLSCSTTMAAEWSKPPGP
jgi:hypothetical protein